MDELISARIETVGKKTGKLIDDIEVLYRAQIYEVQKEGTGVGVASQLQEAEGHMRRALYSISLAMASAEGDEIIGQMKADLDEFAKRNAE